MVTMHSYKINVIFLSGFNYLTLPNQIPLDNFQFLVLLQNIEIHVLTL